MNTDITSIRELDWNSYCEYVNRLSTRIEQTKATYKYIAGVETDDMILAVLLSHKLNIPVITDMNLFSLLVGVLDDASDVLVVSNVVETGNTFKSIEDHINSKFDTAVLFKDKNSSFTPTYVEEIPNDRIYFPWQQCGIDYPEE